MQVHMMLRLLSVAAFTFTANAVQLSLNSEREKSTSNRITHAVQKAWKMYQAETALCTEFKVPDDLQPCENNKKLDPHVTLQEFIDSFETHSFQVIVRPVSAQARTLMCNNAGVGKGFDIKAKSSKNKDETIPISGYVPVCQQCIEDTELEEMKNKNVEDLNYDITAGEFSLLQTAAIAEENKTLDSCPAKSIRMKFIDKKKQSNEKVKFCKTFNVDCGGKCYQTYRPSSKAFQKKALTSLQEGGGEPKGVDRTCVKIKTNLYETPVYFPFLAYKIGDDINPVVSDYDMLMVAECDATQTFPVYNGDPQYKDANKKYYYKLSKLIQRMTLCIRDEWKTAKCLENKEAGSESLVEQIIDLSKNRETTGIGLHADSVANTFLNPLIDKCNSKEHGAHGAIRHGSENENLIAPQAFELQEKYPIWTKGNQQVTDVLGSALPQTFAKTLMSGCCTMINPWWMMPRFYISNLNKYDALVDSEEETGNELEEKPGEEKTTQEKTKEGIVPALKWVTAWAQGYTSGKLTGCPFYKRKSAIAEAYKNMIQEIEKYIKKTGSGKSKDGSFNIYASLDTRIAVERIQQNIKMYEGGLAPKQFEWYNDFEKDMDENNVQWNPFKNKNANNVNAN